MKIKASTQVEKVIGLIFLVCGWQLSDQQTASGAEDAPPPPKYITFDPAGSGAYNNIQAVTINPAGAVAGWYYDAGGIAHGFLRARDGTITTLDVGAVTDPLYQGTFANGITPEAAISGYYIDGNGTHGFLWVGGAYTKFDAPPPPPSTPPSQSISPIAINPAGTTTGNYYDGFGTQHAFLRDRNGHFTNIDPPGALFYQQQIQGNAINPAGAVTGSYEDSSFTTHGFLRAPGRYLHHLRWQPGRPIQRAHRHQPGESNHGILFSEPKWLRRASRLPAVPQRYHLPRRLPGLLLNIPFRHQPGGDDHGKLC